MRERLTGTARSVALNRLAALALAVAGLGCDRPNPAYYRSPDGGSGGGAGGDTSDGAAGTGSGGNGGTTGGDAGPDGSPDATLGACAAADDCAARLGAPPCGAWQCIDSTCAVVCAACTDADKDGYGVGTGCAGPDCDDTNPLIGGTATRSCYAGPAATVGVGNCHAGTESCTAGVWSPCAGQVLPAGEACNGEDDDCNGTADDLGTVSCGLGVCAQTVTACTAGVLAACQPGAPTGAVDICDGKDNDCDGAVDEDCPTACVRVSPNGDDSTADGTALRPFRTIPAAITWAAAVVTRPRNVCVAGGQVCTATSTYRSPSGTTIVMANGISVYGNYETTTWTRCPFGDAGPNVTLEPRVATGVQFPATVTMPTTLDGFRIARADADPTAAVTVDGAKQVVLSNLTISDSPMAAHIYGVNLINGAQAVITHSLVMSGVGPTESIAIRSINSRPTIRENCATIDAAGHCTGECTPVTQGLFGRYSMTPAGSSAAVYLEASPGALVERNTICGGAASDGAGVHVKGNAAGLVVRGNNINVYGSTTDSHGVWLQDCDGATPWLGDNTAIQADGAAGARISAIEVRGACHPSIDGNVRIYGGAGTATSRSIGIACGAANGIASRCTILGNKLIQGSPLGHPANAVGIACEGDGCARIARNTIEGGLGGDVVALSMVGSGPLVERNVITGGCGTKSSIGVLAEQSDARIENNVVHGASCGTNAAAGEVVAVHVHVAAGGREADVHSNTLEAGGTGSCTGAGASLGTGTGPAPAGPQGIFRNNIMRAGGCAKRYGFLEDTSGVRARVFENNDLDPTGTPTALYDDAAGDLLQTAAAVNALTVPRTSGNISADPMFVMSPADLHLGAGSACINAGTTTGAPKLDFDGKPRDAQPDIGAYEK